MNRWKATEKRDRLTDAECQQLLEELATACGPRPGGTRMDPAVTSWKWRRNRLRGLVEHQLRKREGETGREEIRALVAQYYPGGR
jgi:hypothetical protein